MDAGIILSGAGANPNFTQAGNGVLRLSNTGNTANITVKGGILISNDLSTDVGFGAFGTLGTETFALARMNLTYDGASAMSAKPISIGAPGGGIEVSTANTTMNFTATPASPLTITMQTQLPPPVTPDTPGPMSSFDPSQAHQWLIFELQPGAAFNGTFDSNAINFATSQFVNSALGGSSSLTHNGAQIFLTFTPVPEPALVLSVVGIGFATLAVARRTGRNAIRGSTERGNN